MLWISFLLNCLIVAMVAFSAYAMFTNFNFMSEEGAFQSEGFKMFRFYTIDSNVLMGFCSLIMAIAEGRVLLGYTAELSSAVYTIKLMGTSTVMLTFLVTAFFLVPQFEHPIFLYVNSNLFFHGVVPIVALLSFVLFERGTGLSISATYIAVLPTILYAVFYVTQIYRHLDHGKVDPAYDFYNFTFGKKEILPIVAVIVVLIAYAIGAVIWLLN